MTSPLDWIREAAATREDAGLTRRLSTTKSGDGLDLAGNDYLGLRTHPAVVAGAVAAAETYGAGAGASRLVTGTLDIHDELEAALTALTGAPAALVLSSGYAANLAVLTTLADAGTLVVSDEHAHASLIDGCRLSRAAVSVARHNDLDHVAELLGRRESPRAVVVAESIYSVLGDAAPVEELIALTAEAGAILVVDEAHALGVVGPGAAASSPRPGRAAPSTSSSRRPSRSRLRHRAVRCSRRRSSASTSSTPRAPSSTTPAWRRRPRAPPSPRSRCSTSTQSSRPACTPTPPGSPTPAASQHPAGAVMSVAMAGPHEAVDAVEKARVHGIRIGCFRPPSTPDGTSRLRLTAHADHAEHDLDRACEVLAMLTGPRG